MHILFITDNFYPETNAPAIRTFEHANNWVKKGHRITILTCVPNYPKGKVFNGYKNKLYQKEMLDNGIEIVRVWSYMSANEGFLKRIVDYASFGVMAVLLGAFVKKPDIIIGTSPQPFAVMAARWLSIFKRKPFVFELRDLWPESITAVSAMKESRMLNFFGLIMNRLYQKSDLIISVTDTFKKDLVSRKVNENKIKVIKNGADIDNIKVTMDKKDVVSLHDLPKEKFYIGYIGTIGMAHGLQTVIEAAKKLRNHKKVHFIVMGDGAQKSALMRYAQENQLSNITFLPSSTRADALNLLSVLNASIVHLKDTPLFRTVIPSKIFEAMALSKPILMGVKGESGELVKSSGCGIHFEPESSKALVNAILEAYQSPQKLLEQGILGKQFVYQNFNREVLAENMLDALEALVDE